MTTARISAIFVIPAKAGIHMRHRDYVSITYVERVSVYMHCNGAETGFRILGFVIPAKAGIHMRRRYYVRITYVKRVDVYMHCNGGETGFLRSQE